MKLVMGYHKPPGWDDISRQVTIIVPQNAQLQNYQSLICPLLEADLQSVDWCDELLAHIYQSQKNAVTSQWFGNNMMVEIGGNTLTISSLISEDQACFAVDEIKHIIQNWRNFLQMPRSKASKIEIDLSL